MGFSFSVSIRYLFSKSRSKYLSLLTLFSVAGIMVGTASLLIVLSVMDGFEVELKKRLFNDDSHVVIEPIHTLEGYERGLAPKTAFAPFISKTKEVGLAESQLTSVLQTEVMLRSGSRVTGAVVKGLEDADILRIKEKLSEAAASQLLVIHENGEDIRLPGLFVGQEAAFDQGLIPGDLVTLISPSETMGPFGRVPKIKRFVVEGIYKGGSTDQELTTVFATQESIASFLRIKDRVSQYELRASTLDEAEKTAAVFRAISPDFRVKTWKDLNAALFFSLKLERVAMFIAVSFIVLVASFNIFAGLWWMVIEKRREIAILKTCGASPISVLRIFLFKGIFLGLTGIVSGVLLSLVISAGLRRYEFIKLPDIFYDTSLPVTFNGLYYTIVPLTSFAVVLISSFFPALKASREIPLDGLRG